MSIRGYVEELEQIHDEIKRNNIRNKALRQRAKELELSITEYLTEKGQGGVKYKGRAIVIEQKESFPLKNKKDKEEAIISFLTELGVSNPSDAYLNLQRVQKRDPVERTKLKFKKLPNKV